MPAFVLRHALRRRLGAEWSGEGLASELALDSGTLLSALHQEGWITPSPRPGAWTNTIQGNALAQAKARRVSRSVAQRHLDALMERVHTLKEDRSQLYRVYRVALFGSFADPNAKDVGDVDVVIELATKEPNWERHLALEDAYREAEDARGRNFRGFLDRLLAPRLDPLKFLKARSSVLSIHDASEYEGLPMSTFTVIYEDPIDEPDRTIPAVARSAPRL